MTTEVETIVAVEATPLAQWLVSAKSSPHPELVAYHGVLTPHRLDVPERETGALLTGTAVHDLGWLRRIEVRGEDRVRWLSGMVTNGVESLARGDGAYNLVLNAQGRIQGDCVVWRDANSELDGLEIVVTAAQEAALLGHFERFIIMDDVELVPVTGQTAIGLSGPGASAVLTRLGVAALPEMLTSRRVSVSIAGDDVAVDLRRGFGTLVPHYALWFAEDELSGLWEALTAASAVPVGAEALETLRVAEGIPTYGVDIQSRDLAQETSQDRAISFTKGCYLGQEIVERVRSRGQVHRHLRALELFVEGENPLPAVGIELLGSVEDKPAGHLTSIAALEDGGTRRVFAIGMIRAEVGNRPLAFPGGAARILSMAPNLTGGAEAAKEQA